MVDDSVLSRRGAEILSILHARFIGGQIFLRSNSRLSALLAAPLKPIEGQHEQRNTSANEITQSLCPPLGTFLYRCG